MRNGWSVNRRWKFELNSCAGPRDLPLAMVTRVFAPGVVIG